jgi:hypothetical protein
LIFKQPAHKRLRAWRDFRQQLEVVPDPFSAVADFYSHVHCAKISSDPYDQATWPSPWELIEENEYCPINKLLGVAYSLQLTDRFKNWNPKIAIAVDNDNKCVYYLLYYRDKVYGYEDDAWIPAEILPKTLTIKKIYHLDSRH